MNYSELTSLSNLFQAWKEFRKGKKKRVDLQIFERHLEDNLFVLQESLQKKIYKHGGYEEFYVQDPKVRHIHKATVVDRVVHHLLYKYLYGLFDPIFISASFSCRLNKGTHKGVNHLEIFTRKVSKNYTQPCWALKCDIKKFFASVDHKILEALLKRKIASLETLGLLDQVIKSFHSGKGEDKGIPLGNLTSQIFANIYLNQLDQFVKSKLKIKYYLRYADDFVFLAKNKSDPERLIDSIRCFLQNFLKLELHPKKIIFRKLEWGIDFLGYVILPHYRLPRTKTRRRIFRKLQNKVKYQALQSYLGYLCHANTFQLRRAVETNIMEEGGLNGQNC